MSAGGAIAAGSITDFLASSSVAGGSELQPPETMATVTAVNTSKVDRIMRENLLGSENDE
jgi:hypothetical protein